MPTRAQYGAALTVAAVAPTAFAMTGPTLYAVRDIASDPEGRKQVRFAQFAGAAATVLLGTGIALITPGNNWPIILASVVVSVAIVGAYEYALKEPV